MEAALHMDETVQMTDGNDYIDNDELPMALTQRFGKSKSINPPINQPASVNNNEVISLLK